MAMKGRLRISLLVGIIVLSIMVLTIYLDFMDMFVWSAIHHHSAKGKLKSEFITFCLLMWNMGQLAMMTVTVKTLANVEKDQ